MIELLAVMSKKRLSQKTRFEILDFLIDSTDRSNAKVEAKAIVDSSKTEDEILQQITQYMKGEHHNGIFY